MLGNLDMFCRLLISFFTKITFSNIFLVIPSECQTVSIQISPTFVAPDLGPILSADDNSRQIVIKEIKMLLKDTDTHLTDVIENNLYFLFTIVLLNPDVFSILIQKHLACWLESSLVSMLHTKPS